MSSRQRKDATRYATLEDWRRAQDYTLQQAADFLELPLTTYFNFERGNRHPRPATMKDIMARTGVAIEFLAGVA